MSLEQKIPDSVIVIPHTHAIANQEEFLSRGHAASQLRQEEAAKQAKRQLNKDRKRIAELDNIIKKLYESYAIGRMQATLPRAVPERDTGETSGLSTIRRPTSVQKVRALPLGHILSEAQPKVISQWRLR